MTAFTTECRAFLLEKARTGKLGTVRADGRPHVTPIWFDVDGDTIVFTTCRTSVKGVNIRRDARVCLCVDDETPPFSFVIIEGTATMATDPEHLQHWETRLTGR